MNFVNSLQILLNHIGGDEGLKRLQAGESEIVIIRHAGWIKEVWKTYGKTLARLGAYPMYDSEQRQLIRDIRLPFEVNHSEREGMDMLLTIAEDNFVRVNIDEDSQKHLSNIQSPISGKRELSLYDTKTVFEARIAYQSEKHGYDDAFRGWTSDWRRKPDQCALSLEEVLNFMICWWPLFLEDARGKKPLLPRIGSNSCHIIDSSVSIGFIHENKGTNLDIKCVDVHRGFLDDNNSIGILVA